MVVADIEEARVAIIRAVSHSLPPPDVVQELLSIGVCARCIFRHFNVRGHVYSSSLLTDSMLHLILEELKGHKTDSSENGSSSDTYANSCLSQDNETEQVYCSLCLGILQFAYNLDEQISTSFKRSTCLDDFTVLVAEIVKGSGHLIDEFSIEISISPVILANERAFGLYVKEKYGYQDWFKEKFKTEKISVKDALKLSVADSLQNHLDTKFGVGSFRIWLTFTHLGASTKLHSVLARDMGSKKWKTGHENNYAHGTDVEHVNGAEDSNVVTKKVRVEYPKSESDAVIRRTLESLQDHVFSERFALPPEKVNEPCHLTTLCYRMPMYIGGRYLKFSRRVSQSRWIIDDERMGDASVEEIIGSNVLLKCRGDSYKFHAAGREDIDVRMLGSGRPFLVEVLNAHILPASINVQEIAKAINQSKDKYVAVKNLKILGSEAWDMMREGETEKQKQYAALVWISRPLTEEDVKKLSSIKDLEILQRTPVRVLHRRSPLERKRIIHWMKVEKFVDSCQYFLLHLCTQAGTYIKELVHGDLGRTDPSIGSILSCRAEILQLDVTDVKMDCFE